MKRRRPLTLIVLSVIASSPTTPAPANTCPTPATILPAAACQSSHTSLGMVVLKHTAENGITRQRCLVIARVNFNTCVCRLVPTCVNGVWPGPAVTGKQAPRECTEQINEDFDR